MSEETKIIRLTEREFELLQMALSGDAGVLFMLREPYSRDHPEEDMMGIRGLRRKIVEPHFNRLELAGGERHA